MSDNSTSSTAPKSVPEAGLASQRVRQISFEGDALRMSMDWSVADLSRPQVLVETAAGSSHPSSYHLGQLGAEAAKGVLQAGGKPAEYTTTDICDGVAQAHDGMRYPLASREFIANMVEIHANATPFDAMVLSSAGDKAVPAHLLAIARLDLPSVHVPGGAMASGPQLRSNEELWSMKVNMDRGKLDLDEFPAFQRFACPGCGACQYMGTAATMQVMSEALGLALPWGALIPASMAELRRMARAAGESAVGLLRDGVTARAILTRKAFENAITLHAAIGGSLNAVMHLIAVAEEARVEVSAADFDAIHRRTPVLVDAKTAGRYPTELFWYAGGVPALMARLRDRLHLDALTVTGATVGENLVKSHAVADSMLTHTGPARVFDREEDAIEAVVSASIQPGDVVVVRYQGPRATGMPEMFFLSELIASDPVLAATTALLTDGRFSGASRGPCIGYAYPETLDGGPLAFLRDRDLVEIDIPRRTLDVVGVDGTRVGADEVEREFTRRRAGWTRPVVPHRGALGQYTALAKPALLGAGLRTSLTA
ncbi:dihydroxy-acid dehydratase [Micromonospora sp. NBC_01638]|uniref:dihydroxy-acid dehydratase n=1 Tax=Micromonospora sp. NBC_01638 TaxID=2975982 RepID=UPI0038690845|nr:dihydroxy-acid dehydratase [Micromonospora sp. NBC_01638]